jgi:prepilin-type N-terminal cleavage/methylation domain-containing protein
MRHPERDRRGFTIVELLIVIAVIGIIAGILIPMLLGEIQEAQATAIVEEWGLLSEAVMLYEVDAGEPLGPWEEEKMPPELAPYISGEIVWSHKNLGMEKSFIRLEERAPGLGWKTVYVVRTDSRTRLIDEIQKKHDGAQTAYVPGRSIGMIID